MALIRVPLPKEPRDPLQSPSPRLQIRVLLVRAGVANFGRLAWFPCSTVGLTCHEEFLLFLVGVRCTRLCLIKVSGMLSDKFYDAK